MENMEATRHIEDCDVWQVIIHRNDTNETFVQQMVNYISFGIDASVTRDYEQLRRACQPFLACQCLSQSLFIPAGAMNIFGQRSLVDYMKAELLGTTGDRVEPEKVKMKDGDKTMVFLSTSTIYGGVKLWKGAEKAEMSDGKLEVILMGGLVDVGLASGNIYNPSRPYAQTQSARVETTEPCRYQIDGEGKMMNGPASFHIVRTGTYPVLFSE
jgi:diacylglycerol kinase (ATP)